MFQWAQSTFDKLSQTIAPPPEDGPSRFAYCVQRGDEDAAMGCIAGMDPVHTVVNQAKGQYPIHLACQFSCQRLIQLLLNQPGMNIGQTDLQGNTPLHYASMSTSPNGLDVVKLLIGSYGASVLAKNAQEQTPYDVASINAIRQHLLPIQLQAETQIALDNGGDGLPPGIDMGGLRLSNSAVPPPPTFADGAGATTAPPATPGPGAPGAVAIPPSAAATSSPAPPKVPASHMFGTPSPGHRATSAPVSPAPAPGPGAETAAQTSRGKSSDYSRVGSSSAAIAGISKYRPDGFHSSSSCKTLQKKYGHVSEYAGRSIAPPPSSGNSSVSSASAGNSAGASPSPAAPPAGGGGNPFAAGGGGNRARYGALNSRRYVTYGQVAGPGSAPTPAYGNYPATASPMPAANNLSMPTPGGGAAATLQPYGAASAITQSAPTSYSFVAPAAAPAPAYGTPSTPYMPSPPYQSHNYVAVAPAPFDMQQNSTNVMEADAQNVFAVPSPQKQEGQSQQNVEAPTPVPAAELASYPGSAPAPATETLAENWVETMDPSSGQIYFYNAITNETSWEKPLGSTATALPENWVETVDPSSGRAYYYNSITNETSWEPPVAPSQTQAMAGSTTGNSAADTTVTVEAPVTEAFSSPAPTAVDAFASPAPAAESTPALSEPSRAPSLAPMCASDAFSAPPPSSIVEPETSTVTDTFGAPPPTGDAAPSVSTSTDRSAFHAPPKRTISADELFAEDAPRDGDENDTSQLHPIAQAPITAAADMPTTTEPQPASDDKGSAEQVFGTPLPAVTEHQPQSVEVESSREPSQGGMDEDGMMDDVPLSPTLQRSMAEAAPAAATNGQTNAATTPPRAAAPASAGDDPDALFAAIGMPPPPFSARKR